jgi:hypothetical protein
MHRVRRTNGGNWPIPAVGIGPSKASYRCIPVIAIMWLILMPWRTYLFIDALYGGHYKRSIGRRHDSKWGLV